jgi:hypothetical protein
MFRRGGALMGKTPQGSQARRVASGATHAVRAIRQHEKPRRCSASKNWAGSVKMISEFAIQSASQLSIVRAWRIALPAWSKLRCPAASPWRVDAATHSCLTGLRPSSLPLTGSSSVGASNLRRRRRGMGFPQRTLLVKRSKPVGQ